MRLRPRSALLSLVSPPPPLARVTRGVYFFLSECALDSNYGSATTAAESASTAAASTSTASSSSIGDFGMSNISTHVVTTDNLSLGKCSIPQIEFGVGFDGRKESSFEPVDKVSFNHGSAQNINIITQVSTHTLVARTSTHGTTSSFATP